MLVKPNPNSVKNTFVNTQRIRDNTQPQINYSKTIFADEHKTITHVNR